MSGKNNLIITKKVSSAEIVLDHAESTTNDEESDLGAMQMQIEITDDGLASVLQEEEQAKSLTDKEEQKMTFDDIPFIALDESIAKGKAIVKNVESRVLNLYEEFFANRGFAYSAKEVIVNLEEYLQAFFLSQLSSSRDIQEDEMRFIWSVLSLADIFTGKNSFEECLSFAQSLIKNTPYSILISVAVDKFYEKNETKTILLELYDLYSVLCTLSKIKPLKMEKLFENIVTFAKTQGVKVL